MFEFTLINGKQQIKSGFLFFFITAIISAVMAFILVFVKNEKVYIAISVIFGLAIAVCGALSIIKIAFGSLVYHAERTSSRDKIGYGDYKFNEDDYDKTNEWEQHKNKKDNNKKD